MALYKNSQYSRLSTSNTATPNDNFIAEAYTIGAIAVGFGAATLYRAPTVAGNAAQDVVRAKAVYTNIGAGTEASAWAIELRRAGGALAEQFRISSSLVSYVRDGATLSGLGSIAEFRGSLDGDLSCAISNGSSGSAADASLYVENNSSDRFAHLIYGSGVAGSTLGVTASRLGALYTTSASSPLAIGTVASQSLNFATNNTLRWLINNSGHLLGGSDNTYDLGTSAALRPRTGYFGTSVIVGGVASIAFSGTDAYFYPNNVNGSSFLSGDSASNASVNVCGLSHATTPLQIRLTAAKGVRAIATSIQDAKGADVTAANDLLVLLDGDLFHVTGNTQINGLPGSTHATAPRQAGSRVVLIFDGTPTVKHNTAPSATFAKILLAGAVDFVASANDTLELIYDGTSWFQVSRAVI